MACSRFRLVAETTRTSTWRGRVSPNAHDLVFLKDAKHFQLYGGSRIADFVEEDRSLLGFFKEPSLVAGGARKGPRLVPEKVLSRRVSGRAPQLTATNGACERPERSWMWRASTSLPTPVSPTMSTEESNCATRSASSRTRRKRRLRTSVEAIREPQSANSNSRRCRATSSSFSRNSLVSVRILP